MLIHIVFIPSKEKSLSGREGHPQLCRPLLPLPLTEKKSRLIQGRSQQEATSHEKEHRGPLQGQKSVPGVKLLRHPLGFVPLFPLHEGIDGFFDQVQVEVELCCLGTGEEQGRGGGVDSFLVGTGAGV